MYDIFTNLIIAIKTFDLYRFQQKQYIVLLGHDTEVVIVFALLPPSWLKHPAHL